MKRKIFWFYISASIIAIVFLIFLLNSLNIPLYLISKERCECHHMIPNPFYIFFGMLLILGSIPISYYFISKKMVEKMNNQMEFFTKLTNKNKKQTNNEKHPVLKFLNSNERLVIERLIEDEKGLFQSEISKMEDLSKLKAHRIVKSLEFKKIIRTEPYGKTKKIFLTKEFKESLNFN